MRREEFLRQLEVLLSDISEEERAEAMAFYRSYFEDAGIGNEERILEELGSPENVAEIIKRDLGMVMVADNTGEDTDEAHQTYTYTSGQSQNSTYTRYEDPKEKAWYNNSTVILVIILLVLTSPLWFGILSGLFGAIFGISVALIAITFAMFAVGIAFVGVGVPMVVGISGAAGVAFIGAGLLVLAVAILLLNVCVWVFGKFFPWAVKGIIDLCKKPFQKNKEAQTA